MLKGHRQAMSGKRAYMAHVVSIIKKRERATGNSMVTSKSIPDIGFKESYSKVNKKTGRKAPLN